MNIIDIVTFWYKEVCVELFVILLVVGICSVIWIVWKEKIIRMLGWDEEEERKKMLNKIKRRNNK